MAFKFGKMVVHAVIIGLLLAIMFMLVQGRGVTSTYEPADLVTEAGPKARADPSSIFAIKPKLDCTPGPSENSSWYTSGLTPGGVCGDGEYVRDQQRDYAIVDGVGGSLLEK